MQTTILESPPVEAFSRPECYETSPKHFFAIAITADDGQEYYFATAQFLDGHLSKNARIQEDENAPAERLHLRYATGEVVILGSRLRRMVSGLQAGELQWMKPLGRRYARVPSGVAVIVSITVTRKDDL